jgi:hypothetical protein
MSLLRVHFDEPEHDWMPLTLEDEEVRIRCDASDIYPSLEQLVSALSAMLDARDEQLVVWMEEPVELEMRFLRSDEVIRLEISSFPGSLRPLETPKAEIVFVGTYEEICLPFWRALRELEGRYSREELARRWTGYFPHRELALLTEQLGKT